MIVLSLIAGLPVLAQPAAQRTEKCIVEGRVISAATGEPVPHAEVILREATQVPNPDQGSRG